MLRLTLRPSSGFRGIPSPLSTGVRYSTIHLTDLFPHAGFIVADAEKYSSELLHRVGKSIIRVGTVRLDSSSHEIAPGALPQTSGLFEELPLTAEVLGFTHYYA